MSGRQRRAKRRARQRIEMDFLKSKGALNPQKAQDEDAIRDAVEETTKMEWGKTTIHNDLVSLEDQGKVKSVGTPVRWYLTATVGEVSGYAKE